MTFAIRSDDGFALTIAGTDVVSHPTLEQPKVTSRQVSFAAAGRYPFELVYFENLTDAVVEWSVSDGIHPEVTVSETLPDETFALVSTSMLVRSDDPLACGVTCEPCPSETPYCKDGMCSASLGEGGAGGGGSVASVSSSTGEGASSSGMGGAGGEGGAASTSAGTSPLFVQGHGILCSAAPGEAPLSPAAIAIAASACALAARRRRNPVRDNHDVARPNQGSAIDGAR